MILPSRTPTPTVYETFKTLTQVNSALEGWSIEAILTRKGDTQVITLVLLEDHQWIIESQSLYFLLDYVVQQEGTRWARQHFLIK
jgi:hypothetical protein